MAKTVRIHGKYHDMFPMTFHCELCECIFDCEYISDVEIYVFLSEVFARTRCPECEAWVGNNIGSIEHEIEANDYE